jgi:hypothetical protein
MIATAPGLVLLAFPTGPGPGRTGGPGDGGNCSGGSCHFGAAVRGEGAALKFPGGPIYKPGVTQRIQLQIHGVPTESEGSVYGFQLSARMASNPATAPGGRFRAIEPATWVQCADGVVPGSSGCRPGQEIQYVQHHSPSSIPVWDVEWTPPANAEGPIQFFVAVNAANGRGDQAGDRIYTQSFLVHPAGPLTVHHAIEAGAISPLAWTRVKGAFTEESEVRFAGVSAPRTLFLGPGELLAQIPRGTPLGRQSVQVRELESQIDLQKSSPEIAVGSLVEMTAGNEASIEVSGCGEAPEKATIWMANQLVTATAALSDSSPGSCNVKFTVPRVSPGEYLIRACLDGACSMGRTTVLVR